jgi:hypothetical protein
MYQAGSTAMIRTKSQRRRCCAPGWLVAGLVLACGGWLSPPMARADCSHYVTTRADAARSGVARLDPLISSGMSSREPWRGSPLGGPPARPCSGFGCSRDSKAPTTAPPAVPRIDAWGCFDLSAFALRTDSAPLPIDGASPHSLDRADRLTRPPRP